MDKRRETGATLYVRLEFLVTNSLLVPSNSTICPRNGTKMGKTGLDCALFVSNSPKTKNGLYVGLHGSNPNSEGT